jgi:hypothetical protein
MPQITSSLPPQPTINDIDQSPHSGTIFPRYCRVTTCPYYYGGDAFFPDNEHGYTQAELHGNHIHLPLLLSLPPTVLNSIGWYQCCSSCDNIFLSKIGLDHHQKSCQIYQHKLPPPSTITIPAHLINNDTRDKLYLLCPPERHNDLESLLSSSPETELQALFQKVTQWFLESDCPAFTTAYKLYRLCPPDKQNDLNSLLTSSPNDDPKHLLTQVISWFLQFNFTTSSTASTNTTT